jgi:hypothetical protein
MNDRERRDVDERDERDGEVDWRGADWGEAGEDHPRKGGWEQDERKRRRPEDFGPRGRDDRNRGRGRSRGRKSEDQVPDRRDPRRRYRDKYRILDDESEDDWSRDDWEDEESDRNEPAEDSQEEESR